MFPGGSEDRAKGDRAKGDLPKGQPVIDVEKVHLMTDRNALLKMQPATSVGKRVTLSEFADLLRSESSRERTYLRMERF